MVYFSVNDVIISLNRLTMLFVHLVLLMFHLPVMVYVHLLYLYLLVIFRLALEMLCAHLSSTLYLLQSLHPQAQLQFAVLPPITMSLFSSPSVGPSDDPHELTTPETEDTRVMCDIEHLNYNVSDDTHIEEHTGLTDTPVYKTKAALLIAQVVKIPIPALQEVDKLRSILKVKRSKQQKTTMSE